MIEPGFALKSQVAELSDLILSRHPRLPILLREIHTALRAQPENVTLMSEEEIAVIISGLKIQTATDFAIATTPKKTALQKIKSLGADAF